MNFKNLKKASTILSIVAFMGLISLNSCVKDSEIVEKFNIVDDFNKYLIDKGESFTKIENKSFELSFSINEYDYQGVKHNEILKSINEESIQDLNSLMGFMTKNYDLKFNRNPEEFEKITKSILNRIYNDDFTYNSTYVNSFEIPSEEKGILNIYFREMINKSYSMEERVKLSKYAEEYVIKSNFLDIQKERLLTAFAIFRYSTFYWTNLSSKSINYVLLSDLIDAISTYAAQNATGDFGDMFQDGKDIYHYAGMMSATTGFMIIDF